MAIVGIVRTVSGASAVRIVWFGVVGSRWIERRSWGRGGAGLTALTVVVVEWSAAEQAVLDRGVPVPAEPEHLFAG